MIKYIQSVFFLHFYLPLELNKITVLIKWNLSTDACLNTIPFTKSVSIDAAELEFSIQVLFFFAIAAAFICKPSISMLLFKSDFENTVGPLLNL